MRAYLAGECNQTAPHLALIFNRLAFVLLALSKICFFSPHTRDGLAKLFDINFDFEWRGAFSAYVRGTAYSFSYLPHFRAATSRSTARAVVQQRQVQSHSTLAAVRDY
jgi:hypothetical protein